MPFFNKQPTRRAAMKLRTCLSQVARFFSAKPHRRTGRQFGSVLEILECRLNLAAVLVIETVDDYYFIDDVDALVAAADNGTAADSLPAETNSEFTALELRVIDELVAELVSEGVSDGDILAITYFEDSTTDELIASGFFDDAIFEDEFIGAFDTFVDFGDDFELTDSLDATEGGVAAFDDLIQLPGAAGNDALTSGIEETVANTRSQAQAADERLAANLAASSAAATAQQALVAHNVARLGKQDAESDVVIPSGGSAISAVATSAASVTAVSAAAGPAARILEMIPPMASAAQFALPFAKFATTGLVPAGILTELRFTAQAISIPADPSGVEENSAVSADGNDGLSYSQIMALFGASGLAAAHWWNATRDGASASTANLRGRQRRSERRERVEFL
jgi:hypothetical protein